MKNVVFLEGFHGLGRKYKCKTGTRKAPESHNKKTIVIGMQR